MVPLHLTQPYDDLVVDEMEVVHLGQHRRYFVRAPRALAAMLLHPRAVARGVARGRRDVARGALVAIGPYRSALKSIRAGAATTSFAGLGSGAING